MKYFLSILCVFYFFIGCKKVEKPITIYSDFPEINGHNDTIPRKNSGSKESSFIRILSDSLSNTKLNNKLLHISGITSFKRNTSIIDSVGCSTWKIDEPIMKIILNISVPISETEKHHLYNIEYCSFEGNIRYEDISYIFEINGGGWIDIYDSRNGRYFSLGCNTKECEKYFVSRGISQEE